MTRRVRVAAGHVSAYPDALVAPAGTRLTVEPRPTDYPGWVWCRDSSGTAAWVPEAFLEIRGEVAVLTADYDSTELTVEAGAVLEVVEEVAGWVLCRDVAGGSGWIPVEHLELLS